MFVLRILAAICTVLLVLSTPLLWPAEDYGQWQVQEQGMATYLSGVCFADHQWGWCVGAINGIGPSVHVTANGGANWSTQSVEMFNLMYLGCDCSDRQNLWIAGAQFVYPGMVLTHDGGETFETRTMPGLIWTSQCVEAVDARHIKVPSMWTTLLGGEKKGITISDDGGDTWQEYEWNIETYPRYCCFLDDDRGWMTGGTWPEKKSRAPAFRLSENSPPLPGLPDGLARSHRGTKYEAAIARTLDGGRTWQLLQWDTGNFYLNQICMLDENEGWAVGEAGYIPFIMHTVDGWNTFEMQDPPAGDYGLMTIQMFENGEGFAIGFGPGGLDVTMVCLHTLDGGQTWTLDKPGIATGPIDAAFLDKRTGWAVGGNNMQVSTVAHYANDGDLLITLDGWPRTAAPGDTIGWNASVTNGSSGFLTFDLWLKISCPSLPPAWNPYYRQLYAGLPAPAGQTVSGPLSFALPGFIPAGTYTFVNGTVVPGQGLVDSAQFVVNVF